MTATILNAAPMTRLLGTQDMSTRPPVAEAEALPQHLPKIYFYAEKGPTTPQLVVGAARSAIYGDNSFDLRKPYANHQTVLANLVNAQGNAAMYQRLKPTDAKGPATVRLMLDVLACKVPVFERHSDGSVKLDLVGNPKTTGETIDGFKVKFVAVPVPDTESGSQFGLGTMEDGDQVEGETQSVRYPFGDFEIDSFGKHGNNKGLRLWAPTTKSSIPMDTRLLSQSKVFPIRMACVQRPADNATAKVVETLSGEQFVDACLKPDTLNSADKLVYAGDVFIQSYQNLNNPAFPPVFGPFGRMHIYSDVIAEMLQMFHDAELPYMDAFSDFTGVGGDEIFMFNLLGGVSSNGVPYHSYQMVTTGADTVRLSENSTIYAKGGSDGTMTDDLFAGLVAAEVAEYANENSYLMDTAKYPESIIYDSGFPLDTKKALASFIAVRKDTFVVLSTHTVGQPALSASEESSLAVALRTRLQMYPESEYFGTPVMRGMIVGRSGKLLNSQYRKALPLTLEIAAKAAAYMGAGNGEWEKGAGFDAAPLNQVSMFTDINVTFTPVSVRNKDWANGLVWVESFDRRSVYFPALHTVYDNDTSVLTGLFTALACVELQKVGDRSRRQFSGRSDLTNAQLIERVNTFIEERTAGRFDGRFIIRPNTYITSADEQRGFSWTTAIQIFAPNMKTVGTLSVEAYRIEDLAQ